MAQNPKGKKLKSSVSFTQVSSSCSWSVLPVLYSSKRNLLKVSINLSGFQLIRSKGQSAYHAKPTEIIPIPEPHLLMPDTSAGLFSKVFFFFLNKSTPALRSLHCLFQTRCLGNLSPLLRCPWSPLSCTPSHENEQISRAAPPSHPCSCRSLTGGC